MKTESLSVGDRVLVRESFGFYRCRHKPGTVSKLTPTKIATVTIDTFPAHGTIEHQKVFSPDGRERGRGYRGDDLEPFNQQVLDDEAHKEVVQSKRDFLRDDKLWRNTLNDKDILYVAAYVEGALEMYARLEGKAPHA